MKILVKLQKTKETFDLVPDLLYPYIYIFVRQAKNPYGEIHSSQGLSPKGKAHNC